MIELMTGFYFASKMDTYFGIRDDVFERYGVQMGGGDCCLISKEAIKNLGITLFYLSNHSSSLNL